MTIVKAICSSFLLLAMFGCSKTQSPGNEPQKPSATGIVRPLGQSIGQRVEKVIGKEGGTILAGDGQFSIVIPPGALDKNTTIGIEPVTRTLIDRDENKTLPSYRLTPHGQQFLQPVTLKFNIASKEMAHVAWQDDKGMWRGIPKMLKNESANTVAVQSTHFSDWTTYESIYLEPKGSITVETGKSVILRVMSVTSMALTAEDQWKEEFFLEEPYEFPAYVDWRIVNGPGNGSILGVPMRAAATFAAPESVPAKNPAEIEAKFALKSGGYMLLFTSITILEPLKPGVQLRINGGDPIYFEDESLSPGVSAFGSDGEYPYDRHSLYFNIAGGKAKGVGTWAWDDLPETEDPTTFEYIAKKPGPRKTYSHIFRANDLDDLHMSPGKIRITEYTKDVFGQTWAKGDFVIEKSTPYIDGQNGTPPAVRIEGRFNLRAD
ncbi:hypothetical protein [Chitinophaga deserti]|uniref:hypothetical protein n=1 Tax=Chitinophaga deserti TaxID=2164099 RepID=UPI000D6A824F|nr:hypothetical protein [Chitinophaga deserti]